MKTEIERKFLVINNKYKELAEGTFYHQGYLNWQKERIVRVRKINDKGFLTVKGITMGATRLEYEYEIPVNDANDLLNEICEKPTIRKYRFKIPFAGLIWEVDEFLDDNRGLIVAEIELEYEKQTFNKPDWIGDEVTYDHRYFNSNLIKNPINTW
ncbi:MAG: CYTH domain-containing protein [Candidatus Marinimicrobia bacterium]|jgi:CYTH domain-containing protein|nr:CYTH domain-containing protein [Candidatus Neomarinimicrobiota bacterium]MBT3634947.1 CYTH domain-containing protein [Candidatus Neomarinimicrobiota bacterium]MBT3683767.1 CYTH domain-containing protein [Candidatus Neomarinimicrobiota bacterium]MBT3760551.1 CYTH domain-containing protein [Candidatus Neomarinimicrobiota bacterium]MBT3896710.1 CYTH domain-containing protein [Candidatus Neomarinimicrobiota bacterium]